MPIASLYRGLGIGLSLAALLSLTGCKSTSTLRTGAANSKMKTFLAVGDKPLPVVNGEPGDSVVTDVPEVGPRVKAASRGNARISGRVFDADGRPVPDARVRLAISGTAGGKALEAYTDPSGAFTLRGVRPGSDYTLIAEYEGDQGLETGRANARTADTDVEISLNTTSSKASASSPGRTKINRVSDREPSAGEEFEPESDLGNTPDGQGSAGRRDRVNEEDLPPAADAGEVAEPSPTRHRDGKTSPAGSARDLRWRPRDLSRPAPARPGLGDNADAAVGRSADAIAADDPETRTTAGSDDSGPALPSLYDDGPNPLPPALEPGESPTASRPPGPNDTPGGGLAPNPFAESRPMVASAGLDYGRLLDRPAPPRAASTSPYDSPSKPTRPPARSRPVEVEELAPGALVVAPKTFTPVALGEERDPFVAERLAVKEPASTPTSAPASPPRASRPRPAEPARTRIEPPIEPVFDRAAEAAPKPRLDAELPPAAGAIAVDTSSTPVSVDVSSKSPDPVYLSDALRLQPSAITQAPATEPESASSPQAETLPPTEVAEALPGELPGPVEVAAESLPPAVVQPLPAAIPAMSATGPRKLTRTLDSPDRRRPTWGEIASNAGALPALETGPRPTSPKSRPATAQAMRDRFTSMTPPAELPKSDPASALCDYDERLRRILDFRLPDLNGKPFHFKDIDADLVLLDFWGTWCKPCLGAVPHLVELQAKYPGKSLAIVGIACEQDAPEQASKRVAATVAKLKFNYPVVLSHNDGSCPLQEALHIQAFPTMVLVDRAGRVLWHDKGATPATLARLDRMIAGTAGKGDTRRQ